MNNSEQPTSDAASTAGGARPRNRAASPEELRARREAQAQAMRARLAPKPDPVSHPPTGSRLWNLPNMLTMLRLVLVIPFAILVFGYFGETVPQIWAAIIFAVAAATDFADGALARKMNIVTTFGKVADPIADKALTGIALIALSVHGAIPWWMTIIILGREVVVTALRFWVIKYGVISASRGGKAKTVAQLVAIFLYLLPLTGFWADFRLVVLWIALLLTIVTGIDYAVRAINLRRTHGESAS